MQNTQMVTVGIPTFNRPGGLRETLKRICGQTHRNLDIVISDNHSLEAQAVADVVNEFAINDARIRFYRQPENIGAILNFRFLLAQAKGDYFMWAADDDLLEPEYIESCMSVLATNPSAIIGITGFDVEDRMQEPVIRKAYTQYLQKLPAPGSFHRLRNYIMQPEYYGKFRILWGVIKRQPLIEAFDEVLGNLKPNEKPMWSYMPIDFAVLARGDLAVSSTCLMHVFLLPTSDGKKESLPSVASQVVMNRRGFGAFGAVIDEARHLSGWEKLKLKFFLLLEEIYALSRILPYQLIRRISPSFARIIKQIWFEKLMRK